MKEKLKDFYVTKEFLRLLGKRNEKSHVGDAIRNSGYNFATALVAKVGSIFFTIVLARLLMPELYGLYNLALSTILFFSAIGDFGIGDALATFLAKHIDTKKRLAKGYLYYLTKLKL